jgi:hypothetical protein
LADRTKDDRVVIGLLKSTLVPDRWTAKLNARKYEVELNQAPYIVSDCHGVFLSMTAVNQPNSAWPQLRKLRSQIAD